MTNEWNTNKNSQKLKKMYGQYWNQIIVGQRQVSLLLTFLLQFLTIFVCLPLLRHPSPSILLYLILLPVSQSGGRQFPARRKSGDVFSEVLGSDSRSIICELEAVKRAIACVYLAIPVGAVQMAARTFWIYWILNFIILTWVDNTAQLIISHITLQQHSVSFSCPIIRN